MARGFGTLRWSIILMSFHIGVFFANQNGSAAADIQAENCGIAAGRDAIGNTIVCNYGLTADEIEDLTQAVVSRETGTLLDRIEILSKKLGVSEETTETLLRIVGEQHHEPGEDITAVLTRVATRYKRLEAQLASTVGNALVQQVRTELLAGKLQRAGDLLNTVSKRVAVLNGTCLRFSTGGATWKSEFCLPQILNVEYIDDRQAFTFTGQIESDSAVISFSGDGKQQYHITDDDALQPIDNLIFTFQGSTEYLSASGNCMFSNPYRGVPTEVSCKVQTSQGTFTGEFISDGKAPDLFEPGAEKPINNANYRGPPEILKGKCLSPSHVSSGLIGQDLTQKQSQIFCDSAIIMSFDDNRARKLIHFIDSTSGLRDIIGFAGLMDDTSMVAIQRVYFEAGRSDPVSDGDGVCKFFNTKDNLKSMFCGVKIDQDGRRTVAVVAFETLNDRP